MNDVGKGEIGSPGYRFGASCRLVRATDVRSPECSVTDRVLEQLVGADGLV